MTLELAKQLVARLAQLERRVVFAESCTGGMVSAELAKVPGVSDWLCGSAVTYRCATKVQWLGVMEEEIEQHTAVSEPVAGQMAAGVLRNTPEATYAASITGHFGPGAPVGFDGLVFIGIAVRSELAIAKPRVFRHQLAASERGPRQAESVDLVLRTLLAEIA